MSKLWKDLKDNMKEWGTAAVEKAEEVGKIAVAKTEELTKISKLKIEMHQVQKELSGIYEDLGRYTYHQANEENVANFTGNEEFFGLIQKGEALKETIQAKENEIESIKQEYDIEETVSAEEIIEEVEEIIEVEDSEKKQEKK
jgi:hypothetical protein